MKIGDIVVITKNVKDAQRGDLGIILDNDFPVLVWVYNIGAPRDLLPDSFMLKTQYDKYNKEMNKLTERIENQLEEEEETANE